MLSLSILTVLNRTINSQGLIKPLVNVQSRLRDLGLNFCNVHYHFSEVLESDLIVVDSKYFKDQWAVNPDVALEQLNKLKSITDRLVWFDTGDSSGLIQAQVFKSVDVYVKCQVLADVENYRNAYYGGRIYTDYYHDTEDIVDKDPQYAQPVPSEYLKSIRLGWNYGLAGGYGSTGNILERIMSQATGRYHHPQRNKYSQVALSDRKSPVSLRMNLSYDRETIRYQRVRTHQLLAYLAGSQDRVSKSRYLRELRESRIALSPFGWGEINLRDFEAFAMGTLLVKPSMSHIRTYPDYYRDDETYVSVKWDLSDLVEKVENVLDDYNNYFDIVLEGQRKFRYFAESASGQDDITNHIYEALQGQQRK